MEDLFNFAMQDVTDEVPRNQGARDRDEDELQRREAKKLDMLYEEYRRAIEAGDKKFDHILRITGIGFATAGAVLFLLSEGKLSGEQGIDEWVYWIAPLMLTLLYAWVIQLIHMMSFSSYYARELEDDIARRIGIPYFHHEHTVTRSLFSFRTSVLSMRVTFVLILAFAAAIYAGLVAVGFFKLWNADAIPIWHQVGYLVLYSGLAGALLYASISVTANLRPLYDRWKTVPSAAYSVRGLRHRSAANIPAIIEYAILPRRLDFAFKAALTVGCIIATALILGIPFNSDLFWTGFWVVFCVDFLAKQATYVWNDVLDLNSDRTHSYKASTRFLSSLSDSAIPAEQLGVALFAARCLVSLIVAFAADAYFALPWLPPLVLIIFVLQFVYDRWAKRGPLRRIVVASVGYSERAVAGSLAAMSVVGTYDAMLLVLLVAWVIVYMFVVLTAFWLAEREEYWRERFDQDYPNTGSHRISGTPHVWLLAKNGLRFETASNGLLFVVGLFLAYTYSQGSGPRTTQLAAVISNATTGIFKLVAIPVAGVTSLISNLWSYNVFDTTIGVAEFALVVVILSAVGISLMVALRQGLRPDTRSRWTLGALASLIVLTGLAPAEARLVVVAFTIPFLVAFCYYRLSYAEIKAFETSLNRGIDALPSAIVRFLFRPWCVRISVRPAMLEQEGDRWDWPMSLRDVYVHWVKSQAMTTHPVSGDGGGPCDLVVEGPPKLLQALMNEQGIHRRVAKATNHKGESRTIQQFARVVVKPVSVPTHPTFGSGLEKIDIPQNLPSIDPVHDVVRHYFCADDQGVDLVPCATCHHIYELGRGRCTFDATELLPRARKYHSISAPLYSGTADRRAVMESIWWPDHSDDPDTPSEPARESLAASL